MTIEATCEHWIIDWSLDESEDYDRFGMEDGSGWMGRLAPLRDELLRGDLRPLYLGWLASAGEFDDDTLEPEPPTGLSDPTPAQQALTEFIRNRSRPARRRCRREPSRYNSRFGANRCRRHPAGRMVA